MNIKLSKKPNHGLHWLVIVGLALFTGWFFRHVMSTLNDREIRINRFIAAHNCIREGFAGKDAIPVLKCDNGLFLETEIWKKDLQ
jgi:hypothetical protein